MSIVQVSDNEGTSSRNLALVSRTSVSGNSPNNNFRRASVQNLQ